MVQVKTIKPKTSFKMLDDLLFSSDSESDSEQRTPRNFRERINYGLADNKFREQFRMTKTQFELLYQEIGQEFVSRTKRNQALHPEQKMLSALHWLALGNPYHGTADMHGLSKMTICNHLHKFVNVVVDKLLTRLVNFPENMLDVATHFYSFGRMPSVIGCVDGSHIPIDSPNEHEEVFVNRYGTHSINAMFVCGPDLSFYYVTAKFPGSTHDSRVLRNSELYSRLEAGWRPFPGAIILGDSGYFSKDWLVYSVNNYPNLPQYTRLYTALKKTRRLVECAIGVMKERFQCLKHLRLQPEKAGRVILCCAILHNFIIKNSNDPDMVDLDSFSTHDDDEQFPADNEIDSNGAARLNELLTMFL